MADARRRWSLLLAGSLIAAVPALLAWSQTSSALVSFDRYHGYQDVKSTLDRLAAAHPQLARVSSIGPDSRGFDLWVIEITSQKTGPAGEKPALFATGNIDGDEPASTEVLLEIAQRTLSRYGSDAAITALLDRTALYLLPMANPFMADQFVSTPARAGTSGLNARARDDDRDQKIDEDPAEDIDGDGRILTMRVRAPAGQFRTDPAEPRLVVRRTDRQPGEWTLHTEGIDNDRDGRLNEDPAGGVHIGRNFPFEWRPEAVQDGAGDSALSEPESRAIAEFMNLHPNIGLVLDGHAGSARAEVLRVYGARPDSAVPDADLQAFTAFGERLAQGQTGARLVAPHGAHAVSRFGRLEYGFGMLTDWAYEMHGAVALAPDHGMAPGDANGDGEISDAELLRLSDTEFDGRLFVPWKPFPHPTLGRVEIGGFVKFARSAVPPGRYLERLVVAWAQIYLDWAARLPRLVLRDVTAVSEHGGVTLRATVENAGALPTNVTARAIATRGAPTVAATLRVSPGVLVLGENARQDLGHLAGAGGDTTAHTKSLVWAVRVLPEAIGPQWAEITVTSVKAGTLRHRIALQ